MFWHNWLKQNQIKSGYLGQLKINFETVGGQVLLLFWVI
jgi:hypothetical protein